MTHMMQWRFSAHTDTGLVRDGNEDSCCLEVGSGPPPFFLMAVADGMGGHAAGEVASNLAVETVRQAVQHWSLEWADPERVLAALGDAVEAAHAAILAAQQQPGQDSMGTTLTVALVLGDEALVGHSGDSRGYLIRDGEARQLTDDHSVVGELVRGGAVTEEEAMQHPQRNLLTSALGVAGLCQVDRLRLTLQPGDVLLLCTDGLTGLIPAAELSQAVDQADFEAVARQLVDLVNQRGGPDNTTVVAARWEKVSRE